MVKDNILASIKRHKGRGNALPASFLVQEYELSTTANVRAIVNELRCDGQPICACQQGYFWPATMDEGVEHLLSMKGRISDMMKAYKGEQAGLIELFGSQISLL